MSLQKGLTVQDTRNLETICIKMVETQNAQNVIVHPDWHRQGYPFMRAAWTEASEGFGHLTWEWWKNIDDNYYDAFRKESDIAEFHMELVDCLHFLVSHIIQQHVGVSDTVSAFAYSKAASDLHRHLVEGHRLHVTDSNVERFAPLEEDSTLGTAEQTTRRVEALVEACLRSNIRAAMHMLVEAAEHTELGLSGLLARYFAKATLNKHRWANGYKEKTYTKIWGDGREDNYFLNQTVTNQLEGMTIDEVCGNLADGSWEEGLAEDLRDMYQNVQQNGHPYSAIPQLPQ